MGQLKKWVIGAVVGSLALFLYFKLVKNLYQGSQSSFNAESLVDGYAHSPDFPSGSLKNFIWETRDEWYSEDDQTAMSDEEVRKKAWALQLEQKAKGLQAQWTVNKKSEESYEVSRHLGTRELAFNVNLATKEVRPTSSDVQELFDFMGHKTAAGPKNQDVDDLHQAAIAYIKARSRYISDCTLNTPPQKSAVLEAKSKFHESVKIFLTKHSPRELDTDAVIHSYRHLLASASSSGIKGRVKK